MSDDLEVEEERYKRLTPETSAALELRLADEPANLKIRSRLLGYYARLAFHSEEARQEQARHIFWTIENAPGAEIAGSPFMNFSYGSEPDPLQEQMYSLWREQVKAHPEAPNVLGHAAFNLFSPLQTDTTEVFALLEKAHRLAPNDFHWPQKLGQLYSLAHFRAPASEKAECGKKSVVCYERAYTLLAENTFDKTSEFSSRPEYASIMKQPILEEMAINALIAEEWEKAEDYALRLLDETRGEDKGNPFHWSHIVQGKVALQRGSIETAKTHLLAAGETTGSPQLNSFGPDMALAKALLERGEKETVIAYFTACQKFWKSRFDRLNHWIAAIEQGQEPDFKGGYCKIN